MTDKRADERELGRIQEWVVMLANIEDRIGGRFSRSEARQEAIGYLKGLLSPVQRKNSWQLAEALGESNPYRLQHLLGRARWDADGVRDDLRQYVVEQLGDDQAVLVVDETGYLKKGRHSAGVARQYSGTAGRVENCQVGVLLGYASRDGHTFLDRELYIPKEWTDDPQRCQQAGIPEDREFMTKPALARQMLARALDAGVPAGWVIGDSVYGDDRRLRLWLEEREQAYVMAVSGKEYVWLGWRQERITELLTKLPDESWQRLSAGSGSKGPRWYDWQRLSINGPMAEGWARWVLVRRRLDEPAGLTAFVAYAPTTTDLETLVRVAGSRWTIEVALEEAKGEVGMDQYEVRSWAGWYRHVTLVMWAHALLTVLRTKSGTEDALKKGALLQGRTNTLDTFKRSRGLLSA